MSMVSVLSGLFLSTHPSSSLSASTGEKEERDITTHKSHKVLTCYNPVFFICRSICSPCCSGHGVVRSSRCRRKLSEIMKKIKASLAFKHVMENGNSYGKILSAQDFNSSGHLLFIAS